MGCIRVITCYALAYQGSAARPGLWRLSYTEKKTKQNKRKKQKQKENSNTIKIIKKKMVESAQFLFLRF